MKTRIFLVEDHALMRHGMREILHNAGWQVVGETGDGDEAVQRVIDLDPDLVLLDLILKGAHGLSVLRQVKRAAPQVQVMIITGHDSPHLVKAAWDAGADGYALKDLPWPEFEQGLRTVLGGQRWFQPSVQNRLEAAYEASVEILSGRECKILGLIAAGLTNKQVAEHLGIREGTVEYHLGNVFGKLQASNRMEAVRLARERGILD